MVCSDALFLPLWAAATQREKELLRKRAEQRARARQKAFDNPLAAKLKAAREKEKSRPTSCTNATLPLSQPPRLLAVCLTPNGWACPSFHSSQASCSHGCLWWHIYSTQELLIIQEGSSLWCSQDQVCETKAAGGCQESNHHLGHENHAARFVSILPVPLIGCC